MKVKIFFLFIAIVFLCVNCSVKKGWNNVPHNGADGLHDVETVGDDLAYAYTYGTGKFLRSRNGKGWQQVCQFDSLYFEQLQFFDQNNGWICGSPNKLYKTVDGGLAWADKSIKMASESGLVYGMFFDNMEAGYVALVDVEKGMDTDIYKTENGGDTWALVNTVDGLILNLERIGSVLYGSGRNTIYRDLDEPEKYECIYKDETKKVGDIRDIALDESGKILGVGFNGCIVKESSEGWAANKLTENRLRCLAKLEGGKWLVVGDANKEKGHVFESMDGGKNWNLVSNDWPDIHRVAVSKKKIWIVGKKGFSSVKKK